MFKKKKVPFSSLDGGKWMNILPACTTRVLPSTPSCSFSPASPHSHTHVPVPQPLWNALLYGPGSGRERSEMGWAWAVALRVRSLSCGDAVPW